jgi:hypothetical protein
MLELTGAMRRELQRLGGEGAGGGKGEGAENLKAAHAALRLMRDRAGRLHLVPDASESGDVVLVQQDSLPPLIASPRIAAEADGAILHFHALGDELYEGATLVLLRPRTGTPRPAWSPPQKVKAPARDFRAVFRRGGSPASTTQSASL